MSRALKITFAFALALLGRTAHAEKKTYLIAIGDNAAPASASGDPNLRELRYADDDAAAIYSFFAPAAAHATLLTVLDEDSQRRFPTLAGVARAPTLVELRRTIAWHRERFLLDRKNGDEPVLVFFYSGHGSRAPGQAPALTMLDGALTQAVLYDEILAQLPALYVHLLVDACYAEAVVRPRDLQGDVVELSDQDLHGYAAHTTLSRFPHVGAVVASSSTSQTHEWDVYRQGVFSHELLSGLRGAADVNADGRIEYSELFAFLSAANREVSDERARLSVLARAPTVNRRAPIVDLHDFRNLGRIVGANSALGWFVIEDARGNRLADVRAERGYDISLTLPADEELYLRNREMEASVRLPRAGTVDARTLALQPIAATARGSLDSALQRGLFAASFGPEYYRGFVDGREDVVAVPLTPAAPVETRKLALTVPSTLPMRRGAWASFGVAAGLGATAIVFAGLAGHELSTFNGTTLEHSATEARDRFNVYVPIAIATAAASAASVVLGAVLWTRSGHAPRVVPIAGASGRAGFLGATLRF
jgi:hypothetical protein